MIGLEKNIHGALSRFNAHPLECEEITLLKVYPALSSKPFLAFWQRENTKDGFCAAQSSLLSRANRCEVDTQHELQSRGEHSHGDPLPTGFAHPDVTFGGLF